MIWILVVSQLLFGFSSNANIVKKHCQLIEEYKEFQTTMDTYLASSDDVCQGESVNYTDCASILKEYPNAKDGVYKIQPSDEQGSFKAYCDMTQDGGGWLVIQRRVDGQVDFYRTWFEYMDGFGDLTGEFWLGNEKIHRVTKQTTYELRVDLTFTDGKTGFAHYNNFRLGDMSTFYTLAVSGFTGNSGDNLKWHNSTRFNAKNLDLDRLTNGKCAVTSHGAWWSDDCYSSNLNGLYNETTGRGIYWRSVLVCTHTSMKIRAQNMIWILVVSQLLFGFSSNANIVKKHCQLIEEYKEFQTTMDTYLASSDDVCDDESDNYTDCASILKEYPNAEDGVYRIQPSDEQGSFKAYCDMTQHGGGWLVIQRRVDGQVDFYRTWFEYMDDFGDLTGEFWLGNEKIHRVTKQTTYELRVDLTFTDGKTGFAYYNNFRLGNMSTFHTLAVSGFTGNSGDSLAYQNSRRFTANNLDLDKNETDNCAVMYHGAWWYNDCHHSNLNGLYNDTTYRGMKWGSKVAIHASMKIRPQNSFKED
ncbi:uncharacterized protein [Haliotis asinina]|uniref:uncharacterized protein n=1 Tax=Haliotis asinina TaxID=109174 RepID=UPI003531C6BC